MTHTAAFDADDIEAEEPAHSDGWLRETIVHVSIVTVIVAVGVALRTSFGFGIVGAIVASLSVYWGLLLVHALVRRGQEVANLTAEMAELEEQNAALHRLSGPPRPPTRVPMPAPIRAAGGPVAPTLPGLAAPKASASDEPSRMHDRPTFGTAKAAPAKAPEKAPERAPDVVTPAGSGAVAAPPAAARHQPLPPAKLQPEMTAAKPKAAPSAAQPTPAADRRPDGHAAAAPASKRAAAPTLPGGNKATPPPLPAPLPAARAPFPAAAIALGVAGPDRKPATERDPAARAPMATSPSPAVVPRRVEPHFESDLPMSDPDKPHSELPGGLVDPRAQDIAIMQSLIKGLADQLNAPTAPPLVRAAATHEAPAPAPVPPVAAADAYDDEPAAASAHALDTIDAQVGALRHVATALRSPETPAPDSHLEVDPVAPHDDPAQDHGYDRGLLDQIAGAVEAARIDVYLDPILGLDDRKARHFEVSVRLRNDDGELLDPRDFSHAIRGTGLAPRIEAHTFTESVQLAGQFAARGADASLFADVSAESLRDGGFHDAFAGALTPDVALASRLVMSVAQSEIRSFGPAHWDALAAMAQTGLRYALVDVVDLDVDFEAIKRRGFDFVRLDAQVFLDGLPGPHGDVPAADLCRYLSRLGFAMIVGRIADERELVKVLGFGALLGQGRLFGAPRPVRVEHSARQTNAA
jgi:cyclic-di-GMP phosphodiesterase TipF (flagellum assembly factor)